MRRAFQFRSQVIDESIRCRLQPFPTQCRSVPGDGVTRHFLVVGHIQFVGTLLPTQTLPWQNAILPPDCMVLDVFWPFISDAFFLPPAFVHPLLLLV
jgi:hypothetical protein